MGFGLILAGMGKGIADAGSTYGNMMFKAAESELADQRALQKAQALKQFEKDLEEKQALKDADILDKAKVVAAKTGQERDAARTASDVASMTANAQRMQGDAPVASPEEMQAALKQMTPDQRKAMAGSGLINEAISPVRKEIQGYEDTEAAVRELGGSSALRKELRQAKSDRLAEIKLEYKEEGDKEERKQNARRLDLMEERIASQNKTDQQKADAATTNANKPRGGGGSGDGAAKVRSTYTDGDGQRVAVMSDGSTKILGTSGDFNKSVANLIKDKEKNDFNFKSKTDAEKKEWATNMLASGTSAGKSDNQKPASTISSLPSGSVQIGTSGGKPVYKTPDGKKFIGN